jgi:DGQHR domain-containing protein
MMATVKKPTKQKSYGALENVQRKNHPSLKFYLFHAPASEIYQWAAIDRLEPGKSKSIQRGLNKTKVRRIEEYLSAPFANTIATSVVVVFNPDTVRFSASNSGCGNLVINWGLQLPAAIIVDGQHRVIGAKDVAQGSIELNVVGIVGADATEGAFQFLVINNNSSRVSPSHVKALFTEYKEDELLERMLQSGSTNIDEKKITALDYFDRSPDSPFRGQVKWAKNAYGFVVPNALEAGLAEVQNRSALLSIPDVELDVFTGIWSAIKSDWRHLWSPQSHLLEKACVQALTAYVCDFLEKMRLVSESDLQLTDPDILKAEVGKILKMIDPDFFEVEWTTTGLDTRAGQELLRGDLRQMSSNLRSGRPWHTDLETVGVAAVSQGMTKKGARPRKKAE